MENKDNYLFNTVDRYDNEFIYLYIIKQTWVWNCHKYVQKENEQNILSKHTIVKKNKSICL